MLAANVFHWWLGVILTVVGIVGCVGLIGGYLKQVTAQKYPGKRYRDE